MARTKKKRWSYSAGERGRNRVRVFEHASGSLLLEFRDQGRRTRLSVGHRDRERAKRQAEEAAARLARTGTPRPAEPRERTLGELFDMYGREVTPTKGAQSQSHDRAATKMFKRHLGAARVASTLSLQEWERFIRDRRAGRTGPGDGPWKPVRDRTIEYDLRFMLAVLNWATMAGDGHGGVLLERNPFKGFKVPKEKNPLRVIVSVEEYQALLKVSMDVGWRFHVALVLAYETGHRIGSVRQLRWSDIDFEQKLILWRAETEKTGFEHVTPLAAEASAALELARSEIPGIGEAHILPAPKDPSRPASRHLAKNWWSKARRLAQLEPKRGRGWHSLRRKFASDLKPAPLKTVCQLGGWKNHHTLLTCYQHADEGEMREALEKRRSSG